MIFTKPQDDELAEGYWGRIKLLNVSASNRSLGAMLTKYLGLEDPGISKLEVLARFARQPVAEFVRQHSLIPYLRAVSFRWTENEHGSPANRHYLRQNAFRRLLPSLRFCPACASVEIAKGWSYWKRKHQLPGYDWCSLHRAPLIYSLDPRGGDALPTPDAGNTSHITDHEQALIDHPVIQRYMRICEGFLSMHAPLNTIFSSRMLTSRMSELGLSTNARAGNGGILSDFIFDSVPTNWLGRVIPNIQRKFPKRHFSLLDNIQFSTASPVAHAVAMATLFPSANEALTRWQACIDEFECDAKRRPADEP
ncbi:TniQ family protein [Thiobacillus sedimenti]|uniref:TniQ family protein n=1 Tax=Thiobacillus sedimenti TaxID=3110231 RepID=UPI00389A6FF3